MQDNLKTITILRGILCDPVFSSFAEADCGDNFAEFIGRFYNRKNFPETGDDFYAYTLKTVSRDENAVSKLLASGKEPDGRLKKAYIRDLGIIFSAVTKFDSQDFYGLNVKFNTPEEIYSYLKGEYAARGYGKFMDYYAFGYENEQLVPLGDRPPVPAERLKNYAGEKKLLGDNLDNFIKNLPYSHTLLYGDRGTGKSSTVHALVYPRFCDGLRLVELDARKACKLKELRKLLSGVPMKFVILLDDLSPEGDSEGISELKSSIEGSSFTALNSMIIATSNRRHIVSERQSDRNDRINENEIIQEQLSLSDRFGLTIAFPTTNKEEYLSIVRQLAADYSINLPDDELCTLAERWALSKGGRSPRRAAQFIDFAAAAQANGRKIIF